MKFIKIAINGAKYLFGSLSIVLFVFWLGDKLFPLNLQRYQDSSTIVESHSQPIHIFLTKDDKWREQTTIDDVPKLYLNTLIAREDRFFKYHIGINPFSLLRALYQWQKEGKIVSGGSTLTMQTARLLEPRKRTLSSKLIECFRALQLEWHFSKDAILNIYLTLTPFGGNIEGVNAATKAYFQKSTQALGAHEIALLIAMLQSPSQLKPDKSPEHVLFARKAILEIMLKNGYINQTIYQLSLDAPLPQRRLSPPRHIPHLALRLKKALPLAKKIQTTIDLKLQKQVALSLKQFSPFLHPKANAAILIYDYRHDRSLAYIGSRDLFDLEQQGYVDYIQSFRSPGSTLKPFIYGLAFDMGIVQPESYISDHYQRFGTYAPNNFDKSLHGVVKVKEALNTSLNIPAVMLLNQIGVIRFLGTLKACGVVPLFPDNIERPSLPIALGGLGMTLEQLVELYAALGRNGHFCNLSYFEKSSPAGHQLFSALSAQQVTQILTHENPSGQKMAFKTGTSYGHRDALIIGYDKQFVVGIWTGIPNGSSMGTMTGSTLIPLLQKIFNILPTQQPQKTRMIHPKSPLIELQNLSLAKTSHLLPSLIFPVNDTDIVRSDLNDAWKIPLIVQNGKKPYTWLIDGRPIITQHWQQQYLWQPERAGFYTISVVDAQGQSAQANIRIQF